jgi:hypothetical protein
MDLSGAVVPKPKNKGGAPKGRVISEATREALKKGFEKLKSIREAKKKEKEEKALQVMKEAEVKKEVLNSNEPVAPVVPLETPAPSKPKRQRMKTVSKNEFIAFKDDILKVIDGKLTPVSVIAPVKVEAPVPAPVAVPVPVVEKVLSGNDLLNKIFFNR